MKHENIARAIGGIDDKLLTDAQLPVRKKTPVYIRQVASIAACLVLLIGAVGVMKPAGNVELSLSGIPIEEAFTLPQAITPRVAALTEQERETLTVSLDIEAKGRINILTETGHVMTYRDGTEMDYGQALSRRNIDSLVWTIEEADVNETYKLQVNDLTLTLEYRTEEAVWVISVME